MDFAQYCAAIATKLGLPRLTHFNLQLTRLDYKAGLTVDECLAKRGKEVDHCEEARDDA